MKTYIVIIRDGLGEYPTEWQADNKGHAVEQARDYLRNMPGEISRVFLDLDNRPDPTMLYGGYEI